MKPVIDYNEQLLTPKQLSEWLQIKLSTIYKWSHSGYIPCIKLGGQEKGSLRFSRADILPWLKRRTKRGRSTYRLEADGVVDFSVKSSTNFDSVPISPNLSPNQFQAEFHF